MDILDKIKKLFALSKSPNANEAALALRRAQELMDEYGIDHSAVSASDIVEEDIYRHRGTNPPLYEAYLIGIISKAFGCRALLRGNLQDTENRWCFIGLSHRAEIAKYTAVVLMRKLGSARRQYIGTLYRCKRDTKIRRADTFCEGWVTTISEKIKAFAGSEEDEILLKDYMKRYEDGIDELKPISREAILKYAGNDYYRGGREATGVELQHGMSGEGETAFLIGDESC